MGRKRKTKTPDFFQSSYHDFSYRAARLNRNKARVYSGTSGDSHIDDTSLDRMREACRQLDRDNCVASSILDRAIENIIGGGIKLKIKTSNRSWDKKAQALWDEYWMYESDIREMHTGPELEGLMLRAKYVDGDMLIIKTDSGKVQLIEADRVATPNEKAPDGHTIKAGVMLNSVGKPVKFYVLDDVESKFSGGRWIDASAVIFMGNFKRSSLTRGIPSFAVNLQMFEDLDSFIEATVISAKINAAACLAITRHDGGAGLDSVETVTDSEGNSRQVQEWNPGTIFNLLPGEDIKALSSTQQLVQFSQFVTQILRFAGLPFGLPLEATSLDFSKTNYSSARAALLLAHKAWMVQHQAMTQVLRQIALWKIDQWVDERELMPARSKIKITAAPPVAIQIDPDKETKANISKVQHGFTTNRDIASMQNMDYQELMDQRAKEIEEAQKLADRINSRAENAGVVWQDILGDAKNQMAAPAEGQEEEIDNDDSADDDSRGDDGDGGDDNPGRGGGSSDKPGRGRGRGR